MTNIDLTFRYYYRQLCIYALHYLKDIDTAEDIVQECFIKLLDHTTENTKAFLFTAVRNACIDSLRKQNPIDADIQPQDLEGTITDEEAQERSLHEAELWTAIDKLPPRCREILIMSKREGLTYKQIAAELGLSEKTVEHQISKALKVLRNKVDDFFYLLAIA
ncbi:MAG: RNA polymerase sigma-70 factor [Prevotella sp.]|jgi:RNA polymerase sigma-70 factor (family 1)|nr:RNA polymerase sigma-70 factor [Prevotella sp.]